DGGSSERSIRMSRSRRCPSQEPPAPLVRGAGGWTCRKRDRCGRGPWWPQASGRQPLLTRPAGGSVSGELGSGTSVGGGATAYIDDGTGVGVSTGRGRRPEVEAAARPRR